MGLLENYSPFANRGTLRRRAARQRDGEPEACRKLSCALRDRKIHSRRTTFKASISADRSVNPSAQRCGSIKALSKHAIHLPVSLRPQSSRSCNIALIDAGQHKLAPFSPPLHRRAKARARPCIPLEISETIERPSPVPGLLSSSLRPRFSASLIWSGSRPGPSSSIGELHPVAARGSPPPPSHPRRPSSADSRIRLLAKRAAFSTRLPTVSSRSCCLHGNGQMRRRATRANSVSTFSRRMTRTSRLQRRLGLGAGEHAFALRGDARPIEIGLHLPLHALRLASGPAHHGIFRS